MNPELYSIFLVSTLLLILVPGPSAMVAASQGASLQSSRALFGITGIAIADASFFVLSATGIAALIIASSAVFSVIKWIGVVFLLYMGLSIFFSKTQTFRLTTHKTATSNQRLFGQGLVIQMANPKALMYFSALLPQFIDQNQPLIPQLMLMGITVFIADLLVYSFYALFGAHLARKQLTHGMIQFINKTAGTALIYTGVKMSTLDTRVG
ncbi:LysE family translocator [Thiomicrorhabdus sp. 6S2-11]|uniref:LysE family translocator n=1 Tax=Thiomicrorhabdus marina TaxID=2818442 RepID=A0ABS3Q599_9GAMM|nr:LysE family translocator [Thiomicrorhabdus marina]MBO1927457.1 LysE family translocator [Thiomicrorhabdus marina]